MTVTKRPGAAISQRKAALIAGLGLLSWRSWRHSQHFGVLQKRAVWDSNPRHED
jgi:hypothetical protein